MLGTNSMLVLSISTATIAIVHSLAPDHWVPFVSIARAQKWSKTKLIWVTILGGIGHVGSSIVIGLAGLALGLSLKSLESLESQRAQVAGLLLIGFGLAYALYGIRQFRRGHHHHHVDTKRSVTVWTLVAVFVLGPCEPLIPLMLVGATHSGSAVIMVSLIFGLLTIVMMVGQALLVYLGTTMINFSALEHHGHALAGLVIALTGGMVMFLGI